MNERKCIISILNRILRWPTWWVKSLYGGIPLTTKKEWQMPSSCNFQWVSGPFRKWSPMAANTPKDSAGNLAITICAPYLDWIWTTKFKNLIIRNTETCIWVLITWRDYYFLAGYCLFVFFSFWTRSFYVAQAGLKLIAILLGLQVLAGIQAGVAMPGRIQLLSCLKEFKCYRYIRSVQRENAGTAQASSEWRYRPCFSNWWGRVMRDRTVLITLVRAWKTLKCTFFVFLCVWGGGLWEVFCFLLRKHHLLPTGLGNVNSVWVLKPQAS